MFVFLVAFALFLLYIKYNSFSKTQIYTDLRRFIFLNSLTLWILIIKPFQGLRGCGQSPQVLICVNLCGVFVL